MLATDANIASVGWCWYVWMRVLVNECLDLFSGEALLGFVCWRLTLISPEWAGVVKLGFVVRWANAWIFSQVKHCLDLCVGN